MNHDYYSQEPTILAENVDFKTLSTCDKKIDHDQIFSSTQLAPSKQATSSFQPEIFITSV